MAKRTYKKPPTTDTNDEANQSRGPLTPLEQFTEALEEAGCDPKVTRAGKGSASCPAHDDRERSLSFQAGEAGSVEVMCAEGCAPEEILAAVGFEASGSPGGPCGGQDERSEPVTLVLSKLESVRPRGEGQWMARCPAHDDRKPSLSVTLGDYGRVLLHCFAGCSFKAVLAAAGLDASDLRPQPRVVTTYPYVDERGGLLFEVVRYVPKDFRQRRPDGHGGWVWNLDGVDRRPLYRLVEVIEAVAAGATVWVCEGEKDAERLQQDLPEGEVATTAPGGGQWKPENTETLRGAHVVVVVDNDDDGTGYARGERLRRALEGVAASVEVVEPIEHDAFDHLEAGHGIDDFQPVAPSGFEDSGTAGAPRRGVFAYGFHLTDAGNACRLAALVEGRARFVREWGGWLVYHDGAWRIDSGDVLVTEFAKEVPAAMFAAAASLDEYDGVKLWKWARSSESAARLAAMVKLARGLPGIVVSHTELDQHPWLLNVLNGTIDLRTGELGPHDPAHLITRQAPVVFDPEARAPLWLACLRRWQPSRRMRSYLGRVIGSAATGVPVEMLFVNLGDGANGKGKFFGALFEVLGPDYAVVAHKSLLIAARHDEHDTVKARLFGARLAVAGETGVGDRLNEAKVKELTGGDRLEARRMREDPWQFEPSHTLFVHTNNRPTVSGGDEGIWRRLRLIPWDVTIPEAERDLALADKLATEKSGILNWIVAGAKEWHENGLEFDEPPAVVDATAGYRQDEDHFTRFLDERCELGPAQQVPAAKLRGDYERWCAAESEDALSAQAVGGRLAALGCQPAQVGKRRTRTWVGVGLRNDRWGVNG